jgi:hypothetical protein
MAKAKYDQGVAIFTRPKSGLMGGAAMGRQKLEFTQVK